MKKWLICICFVLFLTGCAAAETFETVGDDLLQPVMAPIGEIMLELPSSASRQTMISDEDGKLYFCDGYTVTVQTLNRGDLDRTARTLCGFGVSNLDIVETASEGKKRWDWAWTAAGEGGDTVGRAAVIDDGHYHYCVTVMANAADAGALDGQWTAMLRSFDIG